jgi:hypothetical protein
MIKNVLTKSRFKIGLTCPRQLEYSLSPKEYADSQMEDPFLHALAKGGFQVSALANQYVRNEDKRIESHHVETLNKDLAVKITKQLLEKENVNIFEAALYVEDYFIRCDILKKRGDNIEIIEVKSKSLKNHYFENLLNEDIWIEKKNMGKSNDYEGVFDKRKAFKKTPEFYIKKEYQEYVYDIAYQAFVANKALPNYNLSYFLCSPSQDLVANRDGLNQKFLIKDNKGKYEVIVRGKVDEKSLGNKILGFFNVDAIVDGILKNKILNIHDFDNFVKSLVSIIKSESDSFKNISSACKSCRFRCDEIGKVNGFNKCMSEISGYPREEFENRKSIYDVWNYPKASSHVLNNEKRIVFMDQLEANEEYKKITDKLKNAQRQNIQVTKEILKDETEFLNKEGLSQELKEFTWPLHFIDFETSMTAIPYRKDQTPYQMIFFQFSHHILEEDGTIRHEGEFINLEPFKNPNIEAVRELKRQLMKDDGTIFRWSMHENTVLRKVSREIDELTYEECPDRDELMEFIELITTGGEREMVDLWDLYKRYHYMPQTNGSNSIKYVLPAVMDNFKPLQEFLSKEVYGKDQFIHSLNFDKIAWIQKDENGNIIDPYKLLPEVFKDYDKDDLDLLYGDQELKNGGAAMIAYSVCQFTQVSMGERTRLKNALLRYCELDTFAMVMIYLYWEYRLGLFDSFEGVVKEKD